jgi:hypothetical protein
MRIFWHLLFIELEMSLLSILATSASLTIHLASDVFEPVTTLSVPKEV